MPPKYGARVYFPDDHTVQVKQTILKDGRYVVDTDAGRHREQFATIEPGWENRLAALVEAARDGQLPSHGDI